MKNLLLLALSVLFVNGLIAQSPQKMSCQTVIRNATDELVSNTTVGIQISILQGSAAGTAAYVEVHAPTTNANGLASLEIGGGTPVTGTMAAIDWAAGPYFVKSEVDPDGGTSYTLSIVSELLSVPYALHASTSGDNQWSESGSGINTSHFSVGINSAFPQHTLDVRSTSLADPAGLNISNADRSRYVRFFSGSETYPDPSMSWAPSYDLLFATFDDNTLDFQERMRISSDGRIIAPGLSDSLITLGGDKSLVTKEYVASSNSGLEAIDEGNGIGHRLIGRDSTNYGNIGLEAVDLSYSPTGSSVTRGATGQLSTAMGYFTTASGDYSTAMGAFTTASGINSTAMGSSTTASGLVSTAMGTSTTASGQSSTAMGYLTGASGDYSTAMGASTTASGGFSTAMGYLTAASENHSTAMGYDTDASGEFSTAIGRFTTASGINSTAMGDGTTASGERSTAMGNSTDASGLYSTAMGNFTNASGDRSTAMGSSTTALGILSTAMGYFTTASGAYSTAMGSNATASGNFSSAMGYYTTASVAYSTAMGSNTTASGNKSTAMGEHTMATSSNSTAMGRYNVGGGSSTSWNGGDPLFEIGNGTSNTNRSNALTVLKNGNMGIGTSNPQDELHLIGTLRIGDETIRDAGNNALRINAALLPDLDNVNVLGNPSQRWTTIYATNGTINTSDRREKKNIRALHYGLAEVLQMQPVSFNWKNKNSPDLKLGLIAQELQELIPEVVQSHAWELDEVSGELSKIELERLGVYYSDLVPVLINAIKEQQKIIDEEKSINARQSTQLSTLLSRIEDLEAKQIN